MYTLRLICPTNEADWISAELWELGTAGIQEIDSAPGNAELIATFATNDARAILLTRFAAFQPEWLHNADQDWIATTQASWPGRAVGRSLFLAPLWCADPTPPGRHRLVHNPGLACGTGEHPCTRLALQALEQTITRDSRVLDIGTGSGLLAIAALYLGASSSLGCDLDGQALAAAGENFGLNHLPAHLFTGSVDALQPASFDIAVANINASVLLSLADDLLALLRPGGTLILTGFPTAEAAPLKHLFPPRSVLQEDEWCCLISICP